MESENIINKITFEQISGNGKTTYLTHNYHTYPAKFIPQIPNATISALTKPGDVVFDPFCGCGTTLVEAKLLGRNAIGTDLNPIATLVSKAKTSTLNEKQINFCLQFSLNITNKIQEIHKNTNNFDLIIPEFNNRDHWFQRNVLEELTILKKEIKKIDDEDIRNFLFTTFSAIIVAVSNQESDTRFAAKNKQIPDGKVIDAFKRKLDSMIERMKEFSRSATNSKVEIFTANTENLDFLKNDSVDHIVTSPPYANTYDYYLYHKFRMYWLDYDVKSVQDAEIGSRNRHSSKREDIDTFEEGLNKCMKEFGRILKKGKIAVIVIGDSIIRKKLISANTLLKKIAEQNKFKFVREISYNLKQNSRMFNPKFTNGDKLEHIMFFINNKDD